MQRITSEIVGKRSKTDGPVKDESGRLLTDPDKVNEAWATHFEKLLSRSSPADPPDIPSTPLLNLAVDIEATSRGEILKAATKLNSGKSSGDQIAA